MRRSSSYNNSFLGILKYNYFRKSSIIFLGIQRKRDAEMVNLNFEICEKTEAINLLREELDLLQEQKSTEYVTLIEERFWVRNHIFFYFVNII